MHVLLVVIWAAAAGVTGYYAGRASKTVDAAKTYDEGYRDGRADEQSSLALTAPEGGEVMDAGEGGPADGWDETSLASLREEPSRVVTPREYDALMASSDSGAWARDQIRQFMDWVTEMTFEVKGMAAEVMGA